MKLEGIFRDRELIGYEVLFDSKAIPLNGNKSKFFRNIDSDTDFEIFIYNYEKAKNIKELKFFNLKPETLLKYKKQIFSLIDTKTVIEISEEFTDETILKKIATLRKNNPFLLSIDDFGKHASNFDRVFTLKPNFIKVEIPVFDRKSLILLANFLKVIIPQAKLIAEKVENEEIYRVIKLAGFDLWQGYYERKLCFG